MTKLLRWLVALIAFVGFGLSLGVHIATYFGLDLGQTMPWIWVLHIAIFPLFLLTLLSTKGWKRSHGDFWKRFFAPMPRWTIVVATVFFVYGLINFALFLSLSQGGTPDIRDGKYILHSHGTLIRELTESEYHWQRVYIVRGFSGHWMIFYLIPALHFLYPRFPASKTGGRT